MHGQIANCCPVIFRNSIVKTPVLSSISDKQSVCIMASNLKGLISSNISNIKLEQDERPEILCQRLMSFIVASHSQWTHYTPSRSCRSRRRKISHFWEYDRTYMVKAGRPRPSESSQTKICHWTEISLIDLDKASNFSGLTVIVGRAPHSRWLKRIVGYHRKVQTTQPTNSVQEPHPTNNNRESSQVMPLPYNS